VHRNFDDLDPSKKLRGLVSEVDLELRNLRKSVTVDVPAPTDGAVRLHHAWSMLVAELALEQAPNLRSCPSCASEIKQEATRCRYCLKISRAEPVRPAPAS
jgi:hypothetical protein